MTYARRAVLAVCLTGVLLFAAGCGGRSKDEAKQSEPFVSVPILSPDTAPAGENREDALTLQADTAPLPEPAEEDGGQTDESFSFGQEDMYFEIVPPEPDIEEEMEEPVEDAAPVTYLGELAFEVYGFSADADCAIRDWPGRVCKSRKQLEDLIGQLAEAAPRCSRMLEVCDDAFFAEKAVLFAAKEESGLYGGSVHAAVREDGAVTVCADRVRTYGLPGFNSYDELYFLAVDARLVSVHDRVRAIYKERDWAACALGTEGVRVTIEGTVSCVDIRMAEERDYDGYHVIVDHDKLGAKIFRSQAELDAWLEEIDRRAAVYLPGEERLLAEKIRSLYVNFETAGLAVCFTSGVSDYLGAAVDGDTLRLGYRQGGGGCMPDSRCYILLQPVSLEELGDASRIECKIV